MLIILFERISQIGLLKAVGMKNSNIAKIFLYRASFTVLKGFLAGNIIALAFCFLEWKFKFIPLDAENYFVNHVPVCLEWETVVVVNLAAFAAIMVILLVPCHLISRISPAKTLVVK
ncbi:MAG: FtsX-like permease family protein [Bacteroidetes bacterium]|uniref:FtsX-like permease family protein n=1 Tax=Candidatus Egerieousia excrementavium TaxID=2840778 RepID=A0A9D9DMZ5_9BACT|nr:FtsX-like permease family protein [Candidatus Egerieousia excrementavium]